MQGAATPTVTTPAVEFTVTRNTCYADLPEWLRVVEVATLLDWTTWATYAHIRSGDIPHRRVGKKTILVPKSFFHARESQRQVTP